MTRERGQGRGLFIIFLLTSIGALVVVSGMDWLFAKVDPTQPDVPFGPLGWLRTGFSTAPPRPMVAAVVGAICAVFLVVLLLLQLRDRGIARGGAVAVAYRPPEGVRPAHLGVLIDEDLDEVDVVATIVDLAVRDHLRIVASDAQPGRWVLIRTPNTYDPLHPFEDLLLDRLFTTAGAVYAAGPPTGGGPAVVIALDALRGRFAGSFELLREQVALEAYAHGWFHRPPEQVRWYWWAVGTTGLVVSATGTIVAAAFSDWALVGLPLVAASLLVLLLAPFMPHRTRAGADLLRRAAGFRRFVEVAETDRMRFAEEEGSFIGYLGYAVVFGLVDRWVAAFDRLSAEGGARPLRDVPADAYVELARLAERP